MLFVRLKIKAKCLELPSVTFSACNKNKYNTVEVSNETEMAPQVLGNLLNAVDKTRYRHGAQLI